MAEQMLLFGALLMAFGTSSIVQRDRTRELHLEASEICQRQLITTVTVELISRFTGRPLAFGTGC